jgi:hypothetical protein
MFLGGKKSFEGLTESIRQHLYGRSGNMLTMTFKSFFEIILRGKRATLLIVCLNHLKHAIVNHARLNQASHEQMVLSFIHEKSILVCPHHPNYIFVGIDGQVAQFTHIAQS